MSSARSVGAVVAGCDLFGKHPRKHSIRAALRHPLKHSIRASSKAFYPLKHFIRINRRSEASSKASAEASSKAAATARTVRLLAAAPARPGQWGAGGMSSKYSLRRASPFGLTKQLCPRHEGAGPSSVTSARSVRAVAAAATAPLPRLGLYGSQCRCHGPLGCHGTRVGLHGSAAIAATVRGHTVAAEEATSPDPRRGMKGDARQPAARRGKGGEARRHPRRGAARSARADSFAGRPREGWPRWPGGFTRKAPRLLAIGRQWHPLCEQGRGDRAAAGRVLVQTGAPYTNDGPGSAFPHRQGLAPLHSFARPAQGRATERFRAAPAATAPGTVAAEDPAEASLWLVEPRIIIHCRAIINFVYSPVS